MRISDWSSDVCSSDLAFSKRTFGRYHSAGGGSRKRAAGWGGSLPRPLPHPLSHGPRAAPGNFMQGAGDAVASYRFVWSHPTDGSVLHGMIVAVDRDRKSTRLNSSH